MQLTVNAKEESKIVVKDKEIASIHTAIVLEPNKENTMVRVKLMTFIKNKPADSNIAEIFVDVPIDQEMDPELFEQQCCVAMCEVMGTKGYDVTIIDEVKKKDDGGGKVVNDADVKV